MIRHPARALVVVVVSVLLTTATIEATSRYNATGSFFARWQQEDARCEDGMALVNGLTICMDIYEASPSDECPWQNPRAVLDTTQNITTDDCVAESVAGRQPWRFVTWHQAAELCALRGHRLPTAEEWYRAALGTKDGESCVIFGTKTAADTGSAPLCVSGSGMFDMIGNVWEYTAGEVVDGYIDDLLLPSEGYVAEVSPEGIPTATAATPQALFYNDYLWRGSHDRSVVLRGGFYGSGDDAGLYSMQTAHASNFATAGVGFRCVTDVQ